MLEFKFSNCYFSVSFLRIKYYDCVIFCNKRKPVMVLSFGISRIARISRLSALKRSVFAPRRNASEYAKKFGFKPQDFDNMPPEPNYLRVVLAYAAGMLLIYHVVRDRRAHYEVFIDHYEEGKEYLRAAPNNYWMWRYVPDVDRFHGVDIGKAK